MAKLGEPIRASDTTFWGIFALVAWGAALVGAGASAVLPPGLLSGLHTPLVQSGNPGQLQAKVADLDARLASVKADNSALMDRVALSDQQRTDITRRLGALEATMPRVIEAVNTPARVDQSVITGDISGTSSMVASAEGGTVAYSITPLTPNATAPANAASQAMPSALVAPAPNASAFAVALGPPIITTEGPAAWRSFGDKAGTLLIGLSPLLAPLEGAPGKRLIAGPLPSEAAARELCGSFAKLGISCSSAAFIGDQLPGN